MKKITYLVLATLLVFSTTVLAGNWVYDSGASKWVKDITPSKLKFNSLTTAQVQSNVIPVLGGANPNPAITSTSGEDLSDGYFAVGGGQITSVDVSDPSNVRKAFCVPDTSLIAPNALRFAQNGALVTDGYKAGKFLGYVNLNWYIPTKYNYTGYTIQFKDSVYNASTYTLSLLVYTEGRSQIGTTQNLNSNGWNVASFTETSTKPFCFKMSIPNTSTLIAYYKTPVLTLNSSSEPTVRSVAINKTGNGTVTATYGNLHDQDVEVFTLTPGSGETLNSVTYNEATVTPTDNGNGTYSYTTPLLTADGTLNVTFSGVSTGTGNQISSLRVTAAKGLLHIDGLTTGQTVSVYSVNGKLVHTSFATESSEIIPLSQGVYFVKAGTSVSKVIL